MRRTEPRLILLPILGSSRGANVREICSELVLFRVPVGLVIYSYLYIRASRWLLLWLDGAAPAIFHFHSGFYPHRLTTISTRTVFVRPRTDPFPRCRMRSTEKITPTQQWVFSRTFLNIF